MNTEIENAETFYMAVVESITRDHKFKKYSLLLADNNLEPCVFI